ncbi:MAG: TonB-dependent receptor plug domain-containing protein [Gemmatimonadota bacterium]
MRIATSTVTLVASLLLTSVLSAQQPDTGVVLVTVEESMGMLGGFIVRSAGRSTSTDAAGKARLTLPVGPQVIAVTRPGFIPARVTVVVVRDSVVSVRVPVSMSEMVHELADVKVTTARTERLAGETPIRVEVVDEMEVDEKTLMSPSGIGMLLNETPGLRVQAAAPGLGTGSVRILGLPGQYTVLLADGLPLYGAGASALGPLDISPVDLHRVEIIKGAASSLYGGQAVGGVINLLSKPPTGKKEVLLNRRTLGVTDAATWLSHRPGSGSGVSLLAAGTVQSGEDVDGDGWADQARARRWSARPRLNAVDARGRSLFITAGYGFDDREGGTLSDARAPDGEPFREALRTNRADVGAIASVPFRQSGSAALRFALSTNWREREFGPGPTERERTSTGLLELTRSFAGAGGTTVVGAALQHDAFENDLNGAFDHRWLTPGLFATAERTVGPITVSASARGDAHPDAGVQRTERLALLTKPVEGWSVRASVGTGFAPPAATNEETEAVGLRDIQRGSGLGVERSRGAMLDVNGEVGKLELLLTGYGSVISNAIQLTHVPNVGGQATLENARADARIAGVEALGVWRFAGGKFIANYGYAHGTRPDAATGRRESMPMVPRHRIGGDLMIERPGVFRGGIEGIWHGAQALDDNPYRTRSKPYLYVMAIAARHFGPLEVVVNFENLLNVRQTDTDPLVRRSPTMAGRWTTDVWAPLEGFMANVALRFRWE